jgi:DNA-binding CsgD family transcriptional regulator
MFSAMRAHYHLVGEAFELVAAAHDARAALAVAGALNGEPDPAPRRFATALELAIAGDCDVLLASFGAALDGYLATEVPDQARRYATAVDDAIARGRCPTRPVRLSVLGEPPNCVPRCAARCPDVELRSDDLFLLDRFLYVVILLGHALIHGRTDQFDTNLGFLARYPHFPIARFWFHGLNAVRKVIDGDDLDERELKSLASFCVDAPVFVRLYSARAAVSAGGRHHADRLIDDLRRGRTGEIADALMQAVLALHDDRVLDAGRLATEAMAAEAGHRWIEIEPDLLEIAAVVASRCDDQERALILLGAGESARGATGVQFRHRDQQRWIDELRQRAAAHVGSEAADALVARGASMTTDDALAYARRGSGERKRPATGWDALTPTELQVTDLVAHGLTNPQIAEQLLMSRATVKTHVSHCLTKLGMATRSEIAAEAARHRD